jgi:hypothetical protein
MNDMKPTITPKSDQLNADDLLSGPITIKISAVTVHGGQEQPVSISYDGDNGKPYKPCKSMCRVLVGAWGADSALYVGRSLTLYCDPKVKWGGMEVGGIRISHMSNIDSAMTMALTVTRANKKPFVVQPLVNQAYDYDKALDAMADAVSEAQLKAIFAPAWSRAKKDGNKEMENTIKANYDTFKVKFSANDGPKVARAIVSDVRPDANEGTVI